MNEIMKPFVVYLLKDLEIWKALAACLFWKAFREDGKNEIEAATETLRQIEQTQVWAPQAIEEMLYHAAAENNIDKSKIRDSKIVQEQLRLIRLKEEAA